MRYYAKHRAHSVRLLLILILLSWVLITAVIAAFCAATMFAIWLVLLAALLTVISIVELRVASIYYDKYLHEIVRCHTAIDINQFPN